MKNKIVTAEELSEISGKTKRGIYKNKNLPYDDSEGQRLYDLNDPLIKKWLNGESIHVQKKAVAVKDVKKTGKKKAVKKKPGKKSVIDYEYLKNTIPENEHHLLDNIIKKFPGIEKGMVVAAKTIKKTSKKKPQKINLDNFEIDEHLKKLTDSGELTFSSAMELTKPELDKIKIYEQIKEIKVKTQERRNKLIDKKLVRTVFSKIYEIDMNQFLPMKDKLTPDLAAIFGVKDESLKLKAAEKIDKELWKILGNIKREINRFLKKNGGVEI